MSHKKNASKGSKKQAVIKMANKSNKIQALIQLLLFGGILLFVNILGSYLYTSFDLTEDKRFTLTKATTNLLGTIDDPVTVRVLLTGKFSKGFKRLQRATEEMLGDFNGQNGYIEYIFEDPFSGTTEEVQARQQDMAKDGIIPTRLKDKEIDESSEQYIYPWVIIYYKNRSRSINLLENQTPGANPEVVINNSISLLEYKLADAIQKIKSEKRPVIAFTSGHGELIPEQTASLEKELNKYAFTGRIVLDSTIEISQEVGVVVVAKPTSAFSEKDKFKIDQYVMNGGKLLWLIDRMDITLDSLRGKPFYIPMDYPLNLEDILFRYGVKIEPNLVLDMEASRIPLVVGEAGGKAQTELFPWYYHPLVASRSDHPVVKSLDRVNMYFPSGLDTTVTTPTPVKKTVLLQSSSYTRTQFNPVRVNTQIARYKPDETKFNKPSQPLAVLIEGSFTSLYRNRVPSEMEAGLKNIGLSYKEQSVPTQMIVVSDGDVARNNIIPSTGAVEPLGYNRFERYTFANTLFLTNAIDYLLDNEGVIEARGREVKLRLLDKVRAKNEKTSWQIFNLVYPLLFLGLFGLLFRFIRKKRFATS